MYCTQIIWLQQLPVRKILLSYRRKQCRPKKTGLLTLQRSRHHWDHLGRPVRLRYLYHICTLVDFVIRFDDRWNLGNFLKWAIRSYLLVYTYACVCVCDTEKNMDRLNAIHYWYNESVDIYSKSDKGQIGVEAGLVIYNIFFTVFIVYAIPLIWIRFEVVYPLCCIYFFE